MWTVSARSTAALEDAVNADATFLEQADPAKLSELAAVAGQRRTHHAHRVAVTGESPADVAAKLRGGPNTAGVFRGSAGLAAPQVALVFSGQGTQWPGMGRDLFRQDVRARLLLVTCGGEFDRRTGHYERNVVVFAVPA